MKKTSKIMASLSAVALMAAMGIFAVGCASGEADTSTGDAAAEASAEGDVREGAEGVAGEGDLDAAQGLVGQVLTRDEIESAVGSDVKFEMSGAGCERGVYQGIFYYDGFSIYSRTYDKGNTFSILSVSE